MWAKLRAWIKGWKKEPETIDPPQHCQTRRKVDTPTIRKRVQGSGWQLKEIPIVRTDPASGERAIARWKLIAYKGVQSVEVGGDNIEEAMQNVGQVLGLVPSEHVA